MFTWLMAMQVFIYPSDPSSAQRQECEGQKNFVMTIIEYRDKGKSLNELQGMLLARAIAIGLPTEVRDPIHKAVEIAYSLPLQKEEAGKMVYDNCMKGEFF